MFLAFYLRSVRLAAMCGGVYAYGTAVICDKVINAVIGSRPGEAFGHLAINFALGAALGAIYPVTLPLLAIHLFRRRRKQ